MRRVSGTTAGLVTVLVFIQSSGCNFADGLRDVGSTLGNPNSALIDAPGRRLAEGNFRRVTVDGSLDDGGKIIALKDEGDAARVAVIPYPEGDACYIEPAVSFDRLSSRLSVELPGLFAVQTDENDEGRGQVRLVDFDCRDVYSSIENARLPRVQFPSEEPKGVLSIDGTGTLSMIVPGAEDLVEIDSNVSLARTSQDYIFAEKNDRLLAYGDDLNVIEEFGTGVIDFVPHQGSKISLAFIDADGLAVWNAEDGVTHVSESGCLPTFWGNDVLAYFEPCETRTLRIYVPRSKVPLAGEGFVTLDGPSGVGSLESRSLEWGPSTSSTELMFLLTTPEGRVGQLAIGSIPLPEDDADETEHVVLDVNTIGGDNTTFIGSSILTNYESGVGDLVEIERDENDAPIGFETVAENVVRFFGSSPYSPQGILAGFDGAAGELLLLENDSNETPTATSLLQGVPNQSTTTEPETGRWAIVADSEDGRVGTLYLSSTERAPLKPMATNVWINTARFLEQPRGLSYLAGPPGRDAAELKVYLIDSGLTVTIHRLVNEYRALPWPSPGILYVVPSGNDQGLWYAKAR